jgi:hypothetical protein
VAGRWLGHRHRIAGALQRRLRPRLAVCPQHQPYTRPAMGPLARGARRRRDAGGGIRCRFRTRHSSKSHDFLCLCASGAEYLVICRRRVLTLLALAICRAKAVLIPIDFLLPPPSNTGSLTTSRASFHAKTRCLAPRQRRVTRAPTWSPHRVARALTSTPCASPRCARPSLTSPPARQQPRSSVLLLCSLPCSHRSWCSKHHVSGAIAQQSHCSNT